MQVKLLAQDGELYVFAQSLDRVAKERSMRRRQLKGLWARLKDLRRMAVHLRRDELLIRLGQAKAKWPTGWRLVKVEVDAKLAAFRYALDRNKLRQARRREGRYLLRSNLTEGDPATLWSYYLQLGQIDIDQTWRLSRIKRWRVWVDVGKQGATEWQGCRAGGFEFGDCRRVRGDEFVEAPQHFDRAAG